MNHKEHGILHWDCDTEIQLVLATNVKLWLISHLANVANFSKEQNWGYVVMYC